MNIRFLGAHNCESATARLVSILVDGALALDAGGLTSGLSFAEQQRLQAVLITHQNYDHIRDIPVLGMNLYLHGAGIDVYSTQEVYNALADHLLRENIYRNFLKLPEGDPTIRFTPIEPHRPLTVAGYRVLPVPVNHSVPTVGLEVTSPGGKSLFYTSDTGPDLSACWRHIAEPQLLIIEVTAPDRYEEFGRESKHLTPGLLERELASFRQMKGYLPQVALVHMNPRQEEEIETEAAEVASALDCSISLAREGMEIEL